MSSRRAPSGSSSTLCPSSRTPSVRTFRFSFVFFQLTRVSQTSASAACSRRTQLQRTRMSLRTTAPTTNQQRPRRELGMQGL